MQGTKVIEFKPHILAHSWKIEEQCQVIQYFKKMVYDNIFRKQSDLQFVQTKPWPCFKNLQFVSKSLILFLQIKNTL